MNKKELSKYYLISKDIKNIEMKIQELNETILSSSKITGMPHSNDVSNPTERIVLLIEKYKSKLEKKKLDAIERLLKIENYLLTIQDIETKQIFNKRYIELKPWIVIAREMHMSERTVYRKHKNQLKDNNEKD